MCGLLLLVVAIPFFSFPKVLTREKKKLRSIEEQNLKSSSATGSGGGSGSGSGGGGNSNSLPRQQQAPTSKTAATLPQSSATAQNAPANLTKSPSSSKVDSGYGKDIKDIPMSMWRLISNPIYLCTCLGACMELMIVSGFIVFLPKYLETQFSLGKSQASVFTGKRIDRIRLFIILASVWLIFNDFHKQAQLQFLERVWVFSLAGAS